MLDIAALGAYSFVMSITPGPNNLMVTASGARFGYRATIPHLLGISIGYALMTVAVALGLRQLFVWLPWLYSGLKWGGMVYLLWLCWQLLREGEVGERSSARPLTFLQAALFQYVNPKAWVMAMTTVSLFAAPAMPVWQWLALLFGVLAVVNYPCISAWALFGVQMRRYLVNPATRRIFNAIMAVLLLLTLWMMMR
ncbi:LysE family translocator [Leeia aquatica]|uniref:LysE family translocator n=1 Tax=Leeia aquatica TaxID=2725557 RepID=A0A847S6R8_9NEIS|nr:LysE family translocator [Leeia aquatica]NLR75453.1 LysE family translocator [Leeia aquatica]